MAGRVEAATRDLVELEVPEMHELEDESIVTEGRGLGSSSRAPAGVRPPDRGRRRIFQYHFEFLSLGYVAYLVFYERCRQAFPDISDQTHRDRWCRRSTCSSCAPTTSSGGLRALRSSWAYPSRSAKRRERGRARRSPRGQRSRRTVARRLRADEGPVVLLLLRNGRLPSPPSLLDRRHQVPDPDDRLLHRAARRRRGHRPPRRGECSRSGSASPRSTARCSRTSCADGFDESLALARTVFPYVENHHF